LPHIPHLRPGRTPALDAAEAWALAVATAEDRRVPGWLVVPVAELGSPLDAPEHGFSATVLRSTADPSAHVIVYREVGPIRGYDRWSDLRAFFRSDIPDRHRLAHAVAFEVRVRWGIRVHLVGHGQGGALAAFAGLATGTPTTTFEAPELPRPLRRRLGVLMRLNRHLVASARPAPGNLTWLHRS
jgi:hypothetical protein